MSIILTQILSSVFDLTECKTGKVSLVHLKTISLVYFSS